MADEVVPQKTLDALKTALAGKGTPGNPPGTSDPTPAPVAAAPATPPAPAPDAGPARGEDGKFKPKEMTASEKGLLAAARAERDKRKALEARLADLERKPQNPTTPVKTDPSDILGKTDDRGRDYWKEIADPLVRAAIREELGVSPEEIKEALGVIRASREESNAVNQFRADLTEFVEDMALEGTPVDPGVLVDTIRRFETQHDISLGSTNRKKFENAIGLLGNERGQPAGETPEQAKARADKEALEKARAAGVSPGVTPTTMPPNQRADLQKNVRDLAYRGDLATISKIIGDRLPKRPAWAQ